MHVKLWIWLGIAATCGTAIQARAADATPPLVSRSLDELVQAACQSAGISVLPRCSDQEFLRRTWLDLAGRTPPLNEVTQPLSKGPLDRAAVIDELLQSPEFSKHWGRLWTEFLTDQRPFDSQEYNARRLQQYLTESLRKNLPYDQLVAELMGGVGTSDSSGPVNFLLRYNVEPAPLAGAVSQKFLGVTLQCAECHDHPHAGWKQKDFWGMAAHFARLRKMTPTNPQEGENFFVVIERPRGELSIPDKQSPPNNEGQYGRKTVFPQLPGAPRSDGSKPRRDMLVAWMTAPQNPYLSRNLVNTVWERLLGARLVSNLDDGPTSTPSNESAMLDLLAADFSGQKFDTRRLIQTIVLSEIYQRSCAETSPPASTAEDRRRVDEQTVYWARARIRPLSADQLHLSIAQAFGYHYDENDFRLAEATDEEFTYDVPVNSFGPTSLTLGRSLALYNSDHIRGAVEFGAETLVRLYGEAVGTEHLDRLFQSLLARRPTADEAELFLELGGTSEARSGLQDMAWVILNSTEFVTNH